MIIGLDEYLLTHLKYVTKKNNLGVEFVDIKIEKAEELVDQIDRNDIEQIIVADNKVLSDKLLYSLSALVLKGIKVIDVPQFYQENLQKIPIDYISKEWLYSEF